MHANNEVGTIQPIREVSALAHERGVLVHCDAAQSVGKIPVEVDELGVDLLSVAGHKMCAPKGVGALYLRSGTGLDPLIHGGGHELGRRAGTENVAFSVALGAAAELARTSPVEARTRALRDHFLGSLREAFGDRVKLLGHPEHRLPNTLNVAFVGESGSELLSRLPAVAASTGSACHTGETRMSPVLAAMHTPERVGAGAIRFSLGRTTTRDELDRVVALLRAIL
jgi:cysteine desulfurase